MTYRAPIGIATILFALLPASPAEEIAKDLTLDGWVDTSFTGTTSDADGVPSTTSFGNDALLRIGWKPIDRIVATAAVRVDGEGRMSLSEAYGSVEALDGLTISGGQSYGPFGYYAAEPTGLATVTQALSTALYTVNPVGVWATYAINDKVTVTAIVADTYFDANKANRPASVSPGLDLGFNPTSEICLDWEAAVDPNGGPVDSDGAQGNTYYASFNAQYQRDAITAAGEILYQVVQNNGSSPDHDQRNLGWAAFVTYAFPDAGIPLAVTAQLSGLSTGATAATAGSFALDPATGLVVLDGNASTGEKTTATKAQLALLTNPLGAPQFAVTCEAFYLNEDPGGDADRVNAYGVALEGLYVLP